MTSTSDLQAAIEKALGEAGFVSSAWVVIVESVEKDGSVSLHHDVSPNLPNWTRTGMLYAAIDMAGYIYEEEA